MKNNYDKQIGILDWLIFFSVFILILMVYIPLSVWEEENHYKKIRRERMRNIASAEEFYYELTGEYTTNVNDLFSIKKLIYQVQPTIIFYFAGQSSVTKSLSLKKETYS